MFKIGRHKGLGGSVDPLDPLPPPTQNTEAKNCNKKHVRQLYTTPFRPPPPSTLLGVPPNRAHFLIFEHCFLAISSNHELSFTVVAVKLILFFLNN